MYCVIVAREKSERQYKKYETNLNRGNGTANRDSLKMEKMA